MTIEGSVTAPQAATDINDDGIGGMSSVNDYSNNSHLESLIQRLTQLARVADERSTESAERVALLEEGSGHCNSNNTHNDNIHVNIDDTNNNRRQQSKRRLRVSFRDNNHQQSDSYSDGTLTRSIIQRTDNSNDDNNCNNKSSSLKLVTGIPEDNSSCNEVEEILSDRITLLEQQFESYAEEKDIQLNNERKYLLPESTFSLLVTHHPISIPFCFSVFSVTLSISCLVLTLASSISKGMNGNRLGIPAGVDKTVRAAQFLGAIVGVLMEDEIPQGLQLLANAAGHTLLLNGQKRVQKRVIISSIFRLIVGYLFLSSLFLNIVQNSDVIEVFYDILALEFVENIDDTTFALAKRGFFGKSMLMATNRKYHLQMADRRRSVFQSTISGSVNERRLSFTGLIASNNRVNYLIRFIYFFNVAVVLIGLGYITRVQDNGAYRAGTIQVQFEEVIWEDANVILENGIEQRLLIYPFFNGVYKEEGSYNGYPRYVEMNKSDGSAFGPTAQLGAEFVYCSEIASWVFRHSNILTHPPSEDGLSRQDGNECGWLWRSYKTDDYNILSTSEGAWSAWIGEVKPLVQVSITSLECWERSDCNYNGICLNNVCVCDETHLGGACEFELPCPSLVSEKAHDIYDSDIGMKWEQENPITEVIGKSVYNHPLYVQTGLSGDPYDMRLYKILEKEKSDQPSTQPSEQPTLSHEPTTLSPSHSPMVKMTYAPTSGSTPTVGTNRTQPPGYGEVGNYYDPMPGTPPEEDYIDDLYLQPDEPVHSQNDYDTAPDFADWDDFFESPGLHDLNNILKNYSVVISYSGSRFYGTIVDPDVSVDELFPQDYHAFWDESFNINRTFIISDTTYTASAPVGVDWFEMRRRVDSSLLNPNVEFSYGPYGAMIPMMDYAGTGFFHCLDETPSPSISPSVSSLPTTSPSSSLFPTKGCVPIEVTILFDDYPSGTSWYISKIADVNGIYLEETEIVEMSEDYYDVNPQSLKVQSVCVYDGVYEFNIQAQQWNGIAEPGYYVITSNGEEIKRGGTWEYTETTEFSIPVTSTNAMSEQPPIDDLDVNSTQISDDLITAFDEVTDQAANQVPWDDEVPIENVVEDEPSTRFLS